MHVKPHRSFKKKITTEFVNSFQIKSSATSQSHPRALNAASMPQHTAAVDKTRRQLSRHSHINHRTIQVLFNHHVHHENVQLSLEVTSLLGSEH
ncbi:hypothetical protein PsorP6_002317 [Peronosclerospora sorghi]|uniref:Uncharacterized protein n=1 Tax=Peronosclerospora sorghi TaxID=230839 RepID=A0ACC0WYM3_9STRA|nr:hypothetical protein PsorP6_002317 [Peronosclerospora sorghi]